MPPLKSANKSSDIRSSARAAVSLAGLLALIASIFVLIAAPASAGPTAGSRTAASGQVILKVAPQTSGAIPAVIFSFATNNASRCPAGATRAIYADNNQLSWTLNTQYDPTPAAIRPPSNDQIVCTYTVTISSNLQNCSYSINRGVGGAVSASSFTLVGSFERDLPNYSTGKGEFVNIGSDKTITVTPSGCTSPSGISDTRSIWITNLEANERYRITATPFGNCQYASSGNVVERTSPIFVTFNLDCNWQLSFVPLVNVQQVGCIADAILYYSDDTSVQLKGGVVAINGLGNRLANNNKILRVIHLLRSTEPASSGVCEEFVRLTLRVDLPNSLLSTSFYRDERVSFSIAPFNNNQHAQCSKSAERTASNRQPAFIDLVRSPAGTTRTCEYLVTADRVASSLRLAPNRRSAVYFDSRSNTQTTMAFSYVANRIPVRIAAQIFTEQNSVFTTDDRITFLVSVPGDCGDDTVMFGGIQGSRGVSYQEFVTPGVTTVIGAGARTVNPSASYDLQPYINVNGVRTPCAVRVTQASAYSGCRMRNALRDPAGQPYREVTWASSSTAFNLIIQYDCTSDSSLGASARIALPRGWVMLPFNGDTGTTAASFRRSLSNAFSSLWVWNTETQAWQGWSTTSSSSLRLNKGDVVFVNVPVARSVSYRPDTLLQPVASGGSRAVPSGYSLLAYAGSTSASLASLLSDQASNIRLVFRWNNNTQSWSYFIPGGSRVVTSAEWFSTIDPGDTVFVLNRSRSPVTIRWP